MGSWITPIAIGIMLGAAAPCAAGGETWWPQEVSGGYVYLNDSDNQIGLPAGWMAGGSWRLTDWLSAVGEGGSSARTTTFAADLRFRVGAVLGGARASASLGPFREFGQVLAGAVLSSAAGLGVTSTDTALGIQPGAGLDYPITPRVAARGEVDVRFIRSRSSGSTPAHEIRLLVGVVLKLSVP